MSSQQDVVPPPPLAQQASVRSDTSEIQKLKSHKVVSMIKEVTSMELKDELQRYPELPPQPYKHSTVDLLMWTISFLDQGMEDDTKVINKTLDVINSGKPEKVDCVIMMEVMNNKNNFINRMMCKGFFHYLISKYKPYKHITSQQFLKCFEDDIKWYTEYLSNVIYKVYCNWLTDFVFFNYLMNRGVVQIMTAQDEWQPIYKMFMNSLNDIRPRLRKQVVLSPMFFKMEHYFSCQRQDCIPFENTIHKLRELTQTANVRKAIELVQDGVIKTMDKEIEDYQKYLLEQKKITRLKGLDPDNRLACLEYCIFKLDKLIMKPIVYLHTMYSQKERTQSFLTEDHIMGVMMAANKFLLYRDADGQPSQQIPQQDVFPEDTRIKLFNFKIFASSFQNPHQWKSFKSNQSTWIPVYSVSPVNLGDTLKILIKSTSKYICIGICSEKSLNSRQRIFQQDQQSILFNVFKKKIFNCASKTNVQIQQNIYSVMFKIGPQVLQWSINDKYNEKSSLQKLKGKKIYAFASICRGAQFDVIDY